MILLGTGWTYESVSEALLFDISTLNRWVTTYKNGGLRDLCGNKYKGSLPKLSEKESKHLEKHLSNNIYIDSTAICDYVWRKFRVHYTMSGMTKLLHRLGFVYKKPKVIPGKANAEAQRKFVEEYEHLKANKRKNDPIYFMDGVHPQHNTMPSYGWIKKGIDKEIKSNSGRQRININGAINIEDKDGSFVVSESVNAQSTIELLKKIEVKHKDSKNIYIICDNARYYKSQLVLAFLKKSNIKLMFLPPYSPNLNLIERFWKFFKKEILYNKYYETFAIFKEACDIFFRKKKSYLKKATSLLTENFQILGA